MPVLHLVTWFDSQELQGHFLWRSPDSAERIAVSLWDVLMSFIFFFLKNK